MEPMDAGCHLADMSTPADAATMNGSIHPEDTAEVVASAVAPPLRVVACAARTDRGTRRQGNEDAVLVAAPLLAVADGVGGNRAGEKASAFAIDVLRRRVEGYGDDPERALRIGLQEANDAVRDAARVAGREGMATTLVAALVGPAGISVAHAGDSRAYLLRGGRLTQLTVDHTAVSALVAGGAVDADAARTLPLRSIILRALGLEAVLRPDVTTVPACAGDVLLLCSDGLSGFLSADELGRLVRTEHDLDRLVEDLADAARRSGSGDDVTVVAARLG
jgi:PPM family protein phosphatase